MFHSIRWRLVASFALLTLLTVSAVGIIAVLLVERYADSRAAAGLTAGAQTVALRVMPLMEPVLLQEELDELTRTAAFLDEARVRVLDERGQLLADSGPQPDRGQPIWLDPGRAVVARTRAADTTEKPEVHSHAVRPGPAERSAASPERRGLIVISTVDEGGDRRYDYVLGGTSREAVIQLDDTGETKPTLRSTIAISSTGSSSGSRAVSAERVVRVPIGEPVAPVGFVEYYGLSDPGATARSTAARAFALAGIAATLVSIVMGVVVSRGLTAPLAQLAHAADRMSGGDLAARASISGQDEIAHLAGHFNEMAERLEESFVALSAERDSLRHFIADASHELRTPITALKTYNTLLSESAADDPAAQAEFLADSRSQIERLEWITHNLLDLSRLEAGLTDLELREHDAATLLLEAAAPFRPRAANRRIEIAVVTSDDPVALRCDRERLVLALGNLLDNALRYTPEGGTVTIGSGEVGTADGGPASDTAEASRRVRFWVEDTGEGIAPEARPHIFERFYRAGPDDRADPDEDETGAPAPASHGAGCGLGLAIARSTVEAHGGRIWLASPGARGARFVIELPADGPRAVVGAQHPVT